MASLLLMLRRRDQERVLLHKDDLHLQLGPEIPSDWDLPGERHQIHVHEHETAIGNSPNGSKAVEKIATFFFFCREKQPCQKHSQ